MPANQSPVCATLRTVRLKVIPKFPSTCLSRDRAKCLPLAAHFVSCAEVLLLVTVVPCVTCNFFPPTRRATNCSVWTSTTVRISILETIFTDYFFFRQPSLSIQSRVSRPHRQTDKPPCRGLSSRTCTARSWNSATQVFSPFFHYAILTAILTNRALLHLTFGTIR